MRTIVVGDVHGCLQELDELLRVVQLSQHDTLVMAGDLVDKGPDSVGVVRRVRELGATLVRGNHDDKYVRIHRGVKTAATKEEERVAELLSDEDIEYIRKSPLYLALPQHNASVVHGGFHGSIESLSSIPIKAYRRLMYLRETQGVFWAWGYDGRFGHCYFGHQPFMQPEPAQYPHATGLDLGCCSGGHLCAVVLEVGMPPSFVTVKAKEST